MKTSEELNDLKEEYERLSKKLEELSEDELKEVTGGVRPNPDIPLNDFFKQSYNFLR